MTIYTKKPSLIKATLTIFTAFVLSACHIEGALEFKADSSAELVIEIKGIIDSMKKINRTCKGFELSTKTKVGFTKNPKFEDSTSQRGHVICKVSISEPFDSDKIKFTADGDRHTLVMLKVINGFGSNDTKTNIVISMPGRIVKTTKGKVEGSKVMLDSLDFFNEGTMVTTEKKGASKASTSDGGPPRPLNGETGAKSSRSDSAGGFPVWG